MRNNELRMTKPVWSRQADNGGMFPSTLSVHQDPDPAELPFLAVCRSGWGGGAQARRATLDEARAYAEALFERGEGR